MGDNKVTIISTIFLLGALLSIGMTSDAAAPAGVIVDGIIDVGEYTNSAPVNGTPDLGGVYDPSAGSFAGGPINCHDDWTLYWDSDATNIYIAAEPKVGTPGSCADSVISAKLAPVTGDPNTGVGFIGCTGTFFNLNFNNFHQAVETCFGPGFEFIFTPSVIPPSSNWNFAQITPGGTITPIEWAFGRADLTKFGDTTYTGNLQCLWIQVSAFDSRGVDNSDSGAKTIFIKFDPNTPNCDELTPPPPPEIEKRLVSGPEEIGIYLPGATLYQYTIEYTGPAALVKDTVPAEFEVILLVATDGTANDFKPGKGAKSQSSTKIEWLVPAGTSTLTVDIQTVVRSWHGKKTPDVFKPTSCGSLPINDGATAFEVDEDGELVLVEVTDSDTGEVTLEPVVIVGPSNSLAVEAVEGAKACVEIEDDDD